MSDTLKLRTRLYVAEKAVYYRRVRRHAIDLTEEPVDSPSRAKSLLQNLLEQKPVEGFYALALNTSGDFLGMVKTAEGTVDRAAVYPRELVSFLLLETNATGVLFAHSHPGGRAEPSVEDLALTRRLKEILQPLGVRVFDHLIYACGRPGRTGEWISMRERGDL